MRFIGLIIAFVVVAPVAPYALDGGALDGNPKKGARVFKKCAACHMVGKDATSRIGPEVNNIIGREIASDKNFAYSKGLKAFAKTNPVWTAKLLDAYLKNPRTLVKGNRMSFVGLRKAKDRQDVLAYIMAESP